MHADRRRIRSSTSNALDPWIFHAKVLDGPWRVLAVVLARIGVLFGDEHPTGAVHRSGEFGLVRPVRRDLESSQGSALVEQFPQ
ncbi:hypothetical protein [Streptomyces sp. AK04-3B]|uniref:hypothetical protein n=1 Tax=unclassified Streptomyces TaxID=2593676 RepID=UPI0029BA02FB|nr:hypothetical protein [Streptomyces sp. AK04-3B]MDX3801116.1 hypothetical protein [Streptomyces sp. AK04-3B]